MSQAVGTAVLRRKGELDRALETILRSRDQLSAGLRELGEEIPRPVPAAAGGDKLRRPGDGGRAGASRVPGPAGGGHSVHGGLVRVTCGAPEENKIVLEEMAGYFAQPERM